MTRKKKPKNFVSRPEEHLRCAAGVIEKMKECGFASPTLQVWEVMNDSRLKMVEKRMIEQGFAHDTTFWEYVWSKLKEVDPKEIKFRHSFSTLLRVPHGDNICHWTRICQGSYNGDGSMAAQLRQKQKAAEEHAARLRADAQAKAEAMDPAKLSTLIHNWKRKHTGKAKDGVQRPDGHSAEQRGVGRRPHAVSEGAGEQGSVGVRGRGGGVDRREHTAGAGDGHVERVEEAPQDTDGPTVPESSEAPAAEPDSGDRGVGVEAVASDEGREEESPPRNPNSYPFV